jgi:hypothetical protein
VSCRFISSIDFANSTVFSRDVSGFANENSTSDVVFTPESETALNGMTSMCFNYFFSFTSFSISASISFSCAFYSMINLSISSFSLSVSAISFACDFTIGGSFNCFLKDDMSSFFFLIISSTAFTFEGSYPILRTSSSNVLILLSLAKDDIFSNLNYVWTLFRDTCNLEAVVEACSSMEKTISLVFLCKSI